MTTDHDALSALDAGFLYAETPETPMHVGSLSTYDAAPWRDAAGRVRIQAIRRHISRKLAGIPRLRQRPEWPPGRAGRPHWADDPEFDIRRHVRMLRLPAPGGEPELLAMAADLLASPLDMHRPLWELVFVDGLQGNRVAVVEKLHHALVDGIGGVDVAMMLLDLTPDRQQYPTAAAPPPARRSPVALLGEAARSAVAEPLALGRDLATMATHPLRSTRTAGRMAEAAGTLAGEAVAPHTSLNEGIGLRRTYRIIRRSLSTVRATGHVLGGTVNEVVLSAVTAGFRDLFAGRDEDLRGAPLHALVPVSVRADDEHRDLGNRVAAMVIPLPVGERDPRARFDEVLRADRAARKHHQPELSASLVAMADHWPEPLIAALGRLVHHQPTINVVVTNVPGPPIPLYLLGAELLEMFPLCPLARNTGVSVGVLSYQDRLTLGLWADHDRFPDLQVLVGGIERGFADLDLLAGRTGDRQHAAAAAGGGGAGGAGARR